MWCLHVTRVVTKQGHLLRGKSSLLDRLGGPEWLECDGDQAQLGTGKPRGSEERRGLMSSRTQRRPGGQEHREQEKV